MIRNFIVRALIGLQALVSPPAALAQDPSPPRSDGPAFSISGWSYAKTPEGIEMYQCASACKEPGRVSYRVYARARPPSRAEFQRERVALVAILKEKLPAGADIKLFDPVSQKIGTATILKTLRLSRLPKGPPFHTLSGTIYGERTTVELISSSETREAAESNFALFLVPTLLIAGSGSKS